jgi:hypothetical protein
MLLICPPWVSSNDQCCLTSLRLHSATCTAAGSPGGGGGGGGGGGSGPEMTTTLLFLEMTPAHGVVCEQFGQPGHGALSLTVMHC